MLISLFLQADFTFFRVSPIKFWFCLHRLPLMFFLSSPIRFWFWFWFLWFICIFFCFPSYSTTTLEFLCFYYMISQILWFISSFFCFPSYSTTTLFYLFLQDYLTFLVITYFVGFEDWYTGCLKMTVMSLVWSWNSLSSVKVHLVEVGTVIILFNFDMHWHYFHLNLFCSSFIVSGCWFLGLLLYCIRCNSINT